MSDIPNSNFLSSQIDVGLFERGEDQLAHGLFLDAIETFRELVARHPGSIELGDRFVIALREQGWVKEADEELKRILAEHPDSATTHFQLGSLQFDQDDLAAAERSFQKASELAPGWVECLNQLGVVKRQLGRVVDALNCFHAAIIHAPEYVIARLNHGMTHLLLGNYERGWPDYEWRRLTDQVPLVGFEKPQWDGSDLSGRRLLVRTEQGFGDVFQFIRYVEVLAKGGEKIIVQCCPELIPLLSYVNGIDSLCVDPTALEWDVETLLLSIPWLTKTTLQNVPNKVPYLHADPELVTHWKNRISSIDGRRIGIAWRGSVRQDIDHERSIAIETFAELAQLEGVKLISLQDGVTDRESEWLNKLGIHRFENVDTVSGAFVDTAAIIKNLDLVISCDTAIAHLAGGLGLPVWVALAEIPEWRYLLNREDSPWYPTMRLFRQNSRGDWGGVFERMAQQLTEDSDVAFPIDHDQRQTEPLNTQAVRPCQRHAVNEVNSKESPDRLNELKVCRHGTMLFNRFDEYIGRSLREYGEFSESELELLLSLICVGSVVVDVGANIGTHTLAFARSVGPQGKVFAIEPQAVVFQLLAANVSLNHFLNVELLHAAASANAGHIRTPMVDYAKPGNFGGIEFNTSNSGSTLIRSMTIDELNLARCDLIKIDAEGMEAEVLRGTEQTIQRCMPILYVEDDRLEKSQSLVVLLKEFSYRLYRHHPFLYRANNYFQNATNVFDDICSRNILCLPSDYKTLDSSFLVTHQLASI